MLKLFAFSQIAHLHTMFQQDRTLSPLLKLISPPSVQCNFYSLLHHKVSNVNTLCNRILIAIRIIINDMLQRTWRKVEYSADIFCVKDAYVEVLW